MRIRAKSAPTVDTEAMLANAKAASYRNAAAEIEAMQALKELIGFRFKHVGGFECIVHSPALPIGEGKVTVAPCKGNDLGHYQRSLTKLNGVEVLFTTISLLTPIKD